jgi:acetolactate synthase-1/2/3 large subunit
MNSSPTIRFSDAIIQILESENVKYIFGHPGEQILPLYDSLRQSKIKHVLMRHEQGAAHAADAYARISRNFGLCIATAGPGALNLTMGIATAYKDSVPLLIITGDIPTNLRGGNVFQEIEVCKVFKPITIKSSHIKNPEEGILKLKEAINQLKYGKTGPIHLSIPKDVLQEPVDKSLIYKEVIFTSKTNHKELNTRINAAIKVIEKAKKPVILVGAGVIWSNAIDKVLNFAEKHKIPISTTYHSRGIFPENNPLNLGMMGTRGTEASNYAGENSDVLIALGSRLSERTTAHMGPCKIIQVNLDEKNLKGEINIQTDVGEFIDSLTDLHVPNTKEWLNELSKYPTYHKIKTDYNDVPIKPQTAIQEILDASEDSIIVNDAGSHTTWLALLHKKQSSFIFSGGLAPMGYSIPGSVGASLANPQKNIVVIAGDGGFQMTSQELATIAQLNLPILICIINNSSLGIIKQWQKIYYGNTYEVELQNPDFIKLAESYHIKAKRIKLPGKVSPTVKEALKLRKPYIIEIIVDKEEFIPLDK